MPQEVEQTHRSLIVTSHQSVKPQTKVPTRRKVKSGCRTCKARKIKCDEGKPVCSRCRTTGRVCEGYGIWGGGGNGYAERYALTKLQKPSPVTIERSLAQTIGTEELRYLQLFRIHFIHTVSGWFGSQFWATMVLPATSTEPAILHAVIALSAAHRGEFNQSQAPGWRERFMLQQYSKAIRSLHSLLLHRDRASITIVLMSCQLFTFLEYLRGQHKVAETHLRNGLRLLKDTISNSSSSHHGIHVLNPSSHAKVVDKGLVQTFATLHLQANLFGWHMKDIDILLQPLETEMPPTTFESAEEAKDSLDKVLHGILLISQRLQGTRDRSEGDRSAFIVAQRQAAVLLAAWLETYLRTISKMDMRQSLEGHGSQEPLAFGTRVLSKRPVLRAPMAYRLLLNYHAMAEIMCKSLHSNSESEYEAHTPDFMSILEGSIEVWNGYLIAKSIPGNVNLHNCIMEFGFIPPLYYTAIKCRIHRIRLHAIRLLSQIPHKEGVWDSLLAASIAKKVMEMEEGNLYRGLGLVDEFPLEEVPNMDRCPSLTLPESNLFQEVQVDMQEGSTSGTVITCKRWRADRSLEVVQCHFNGERWVENDRSW